MHCNIWIAIIDMQCQKVGIWKAAITGTRGQSSKSTKTTDHLSNQSNMRMEVELQRILFAFSHYYDSNYWRSLDALLKRFIFVLFSCRVVRKYSAIARQEAIEKTASQRQHDVS